jgi:hypothetical protein
LGDFLPKNFFQNFFIYPLQRGLSPYIEGKRREVGRGDTSPHCRGGGMGGVSREGYNKNPPVNYEGGGSMFDIHK